MKCSQVLLKERISFFCKNQFFNDSFWALSGNVLSKGLALITSVIIAKFLGSDIFGEYGTVKSTLASFAILSTLGLGYTATKYIAEQKETNNKISLQTTTKNILKITAFTGLIFSSLIFFFSNYISEVILDNRDLSLILKVCSFWVLFNGINTAQIGILSGLGLYKKMAGINFAVGLLTLTLGVVLTFYFQLLGASITLIIVQVFNCVLNYIYLKKAIKELPQDTIKEVSPPNIREMLLFSLPVSIQEVLFSFTSWLFIILLAQYSSYSQIGLFSAALQWTAIILFIPGVLRNVILQHLSASNNDEKKFDNLVSKTLWINIISVLIPIVIIVFISGIISSFYGNSFIGLKTLLILSAISALPISMSNIYSQMFLSLGKNWSMLFLKISRDIITITLFFIFLFYLEWNGAESLIIAILISQFLFVFNIVLFLKISKKRKLLCSI
jgi:O-antigen/teichoic acid export membrane protein